MMIKQSRFPLAFVSTSVALTLAILSVMSLTACNDEAAQRAAANDELTKVLKIIRTAEQGFVATETSIDSDNNSVDDFRQQQLAHAATELESLVDRGSIQQQVTARRLLADLRISAAKNDARTATEQWAILSNQSATVINQLAAVLQAGDRVDKLSTQESILIDALSNDVDKIEQTASVDRAEAEAVKDQIKELAIKIERVKKDRHDLITRSQAQLDAAVSLNAEPRHQAQLEAIRLRRQADVLSTEADLIRAEAGMLESQFNVFSKKTTLAQRHAKTLTDQINDARQRDQQNSDAQQQAIQQRDQLLAAFEQSYEVLASQMQAQVIDPMQLAIDRIATTEASLNQIKSKSGALRGLTQEIELDILRTRADRAFLHAQQAIMLGSFGNTLKMIAHQMHAVAPNRSEFYKTTANNIAQTQEKTILNAATLISNANTTGQTLIANGGSLDDPSSIAAIAHAELGHLATYAKQIEKSAL